MRKRERDTERMVDDLYVLARASRDLLSNAFSALDFSRVGINLFSVLGARNVCTVHYRLSTHRGIYTHAHSHQFHY